MTQDTHIIDLRRSYIPSDPNKFAATYHDTAREDEPEPRIPVVPYDGYNFMPTYEGYASYFGIGSHIDISTLEDSGGTGNVDDAFVIQTNEFRNILVAFCDDGIWTKSAAVTGDWTHEITLVPPAANEHLNWTKCVIDNVIYAYRQGEAHAWECGPANSFVFTEFTPSFLTMAAQLGIFKAGGRLGFWDSENSTAWSELGNTHGFTPSQQTLAGASIFQDIVGRIVIVHQHGTGFVIYCTKSIVLVSRTVNSPSLFAGSAIYNNNGISYRQEVARGEPDTQHYAITTQGFVEISNGQAKNEIPEISTYLKEKKQPIYLQMMNGRYLFFQVLDPSYFNGIVKFHTEEFGPLSITFKGASYAIDHIEESVCRAYAAGNNQEGSYLFDNHEITSRSGATATGVVPIWEDHLCTVIPWAVLKAYLTHNPALFGTDQYFNDKYTASGGIAKITTGTEFCIPEGALLISAYAFQDNMLVEDNTQSFFLKQEYQWMLENAFQRDWEYSIVHTFHTPVTNTLVGTQTVGVTYTLHTFGPYLDISLASERNRDYEITEKGVRLQRSLVRGIYVQMLETVRIVQDGSATGDEASVWHGPSGPAAGPFASFNAMHTAALAWLNGAYDAFVASYNAAHSPTSSISEYHHIETYSSGPGTYQFNTYYTVEDVNSPNPPNFAGTETFTRDSGSTAVPGYVQHQSFLHHKFIYKDLVTCVYKELGFTKIKGHGHYNLAGAFVVDNATAEAADYTDMCDATPSKKKKAKFNGISIEASSGFLCAPGSAEIDGETFTYPDETVTLPGGTNFLQEGSIEPIYPTFLGAFVFDTHYKKWGKMMLNHKQLLDYFPINNIAGDAPIPYETFLPKGSALLEDGLIYHFDQYPTDSFITFGKYGQYRKGFTDIEEVHLQHRTPMSGTVTAEGSLDGKSIEIGLSGTFAYDTVRATSGGFGLSARWFNVTVEGNYDLTNLEFRSSRKGKR